MRVLLSIFILIVLLLLALPLAAQEEATEEVMVISPVVEVGEDVVESESPVLEVPDVVQGIDPSVYEQLYTLGVSLFKSLWYAAYLPFAVPMVAVLVALSKRLFSQVSSPHLSFFWTVILWLLYLGATQLGYADQFQSSVESLATLGANFLGIILTPVGAGKLYSYANKNNVAIIGYARPVAAETTGGSAQRPLTPIAENA